MSDFSAWLVARLVGKGIRSKASSSNLSPAFAFNGLATKMQRPEGAAALPDDVRK